MTINDDNINDNTKYLKAIQINYRNMQGRLSLPQVFVDRDEAVISGALGQCSRDDSLNAEIDSMRFPQF